MLKVQINEFTNKGGGMKKVLYAVLIVAIVMGFYFIASAQKEKVDIKTKETAEGQVTTVKAKGEAGKMDVKAVTKETPAGTETDVKAKAEGPAGKTEVTEKRESGEIKQATVTKEAKGTQPVLKKVVKYHSMSEDGSYITVIEREQKVRYPTKDPKRPYAVKWKQMDPIEITATYDVNAGQYVVDRALMQPAKEPMKEVSKGQVQEALEKDAPEQTK